MMKKNIFFYYFLFSYFQFLPLKNSVKDYLSLLKENMPPFSADRRLATKGEYDQEIVFMFTNKSNKKL